MTPRKSSHDPRAVLELVLHCQFVAHAESHGWNSIVSCASSAPLPFARLCGFSLDAHHRAACARVRVLGRRRHAMGASARICREAGGRVTTNVMVAGFGCGLFVGVRSPCERRGAAHDGDEGRRRLTRSWWCVVEVGGTWSLETQAIFSQDCHCFRQDAEWSRQWLQLLMGPRPPSVQWPRSRQFTAKGQGKGRGR